MKSISVIGSRVHFWNPTKLKYDWLESDVVILRLKIKIL